MATALVADQELQQELGPEAAPQATRDGIPTFWLRANEIHDAVRRLRNDVSRPFKMLYDLTVLARAPAEKRPSCSSDRNGSVPHVRREAGRGTRSIAFPPRRVGHVARPRRLRFSVSERRSSAPGDPRRSSHCARTGW